MPNFWMMSNRNILTDAAGAPTGFGGDLGLLTYWVSDAVAPGALSSIGSWRQIAHDDFKSQLTKAAGQFPNLAPGDNENQKHVCFFVHGYNNGWMDAAQRYQDIATGMFNGPDGLGICVSFDWPSYGSVLGYYPDRAHATQCAAAFTQVLGEIYDWLLLTQQAAVSSPDQQNTDGTGPSGACRAKISIIAHSMGNFLLQKAASATWTRKNQPLLASLMNQVIMAAADVDNNLFDPTCQDAKDGTALVNLSYRITSLYSGRDAVLGASAGLKHFGERRLGRSGLATNPPAGVSNVWQVDCSGFFDPAISGLAVHGAYFTTPEVMTLMKNVLKGIDRKVLDTLGLTEGTVWPVPPLPAPPAAANP